MEGLERKLVVLFAEISGSAKLYERLGEAEALRAVDRCVKRMERAIQAFEGRLVKVVGHELRAVFDTAEGACEAALEMQQRVADLPPVSGVKLAIRAAFHGGLAIDRDRDISGEAVETTARLITLGQAGQILTSASALQELPVHLRDRIIAHPGETIGNVQGIQIHQHKSEDAVPPAAKPEARRPPATAPKPEPAKRTAPHEAALPSGKLCLRYRGRAYLLDEKTPILSLGRDSGSDIVIEDRKASRHHARVEKRDSRFFYVDRSSNGSYVALGNTQETMVRHTEIALQGSGSICFGSSINDPLADCATFEHL